jgi:predicted HAD superfamily phosphohydrolase YqeG
MREIRPVIVDVDRFLEEAARAQQQHEADRWRHELRPRAIRAFAGRAA